MAIKVEYEGFSAMATDKKSANAALKAKAFLEEFGFKLLGWSANEGLFVTGAWKEVSDYVFCISSADDDHDKINQHDNFSLPEDINLPCEVDVYKRPFKPADVGNGEIIPWEMDGSAPVNTNADNQAIIECFFRDLPAAVRFCDWVSQQR